ncbi:unnamed protein product [Cyclocybe aegerita]|uniref:Uncharacterized protein n=1 Tax=Cyclocybe aegerita TaxID=1973307 RepID=A0A8S0XJM2_CYCAE|nr:unnamed protein product [Cyclocybe aegerita]
MCNLRLMEAPPPQPLGALSKFQGDALNGMVAAPSRPSIKMAGGERQLVSYKGGSSPSCPCRILLTPSPSIAFSSPTTYLHSERQRLDLARCYLILAYKGCWLAEIVDGETPLPTNDVCWDELFGSQATLTLSAPPPPSPQDPPRDAQSKEIVRLLELETPSRGRPKALCNKDIQLMVVRLPDSDKDILTMSIKFSHHKGSDNRPKPYTYLLFHADQAGYLLPCQLMVSIAVLDDAFDSPTPTSVKAV